MSFRQPIRNSSARQEYFLKLAKDAHQSSGRTLRELGARTGLNFTYISQILNDQRRPSRDTIILLCTYGWELELEDTDSILESLDYKTLSLKRPESALANNS